MSLEQIGLAARVASRVLSGASTTAKAQALRAIADALEANAATIIAANELDLAAGRTQGLSVGLLDRLALNKERIDQISAATRQVCALPDPVGVVSGGHRRPNGLEIVQMRVPLGVVGMIYEARPNVTVDAAALCLYSGNAAVLRGSASAIESNKVLVALMRDAIADAGLPADAVQLIEDTSRESVIELMRLREYIDVLIPRGGADLIRTVVEGASVPVIETGVGNCHVYVDAAADASAAIPIVLNAKVSRPSVCNAAETLLVHRAIAGDFLPKVVAELIGAGVEVRGDAEAQAVSSSVIKATDDDYRAEFGDLIMAVKVVGSLAEAIEHVNAYGTRHTEAILTQDYAAAQRFAADVDAACIMINASTRFADGSEFGMGAEIGISTQKLHARGPFALEALTTVKWIVRGSGQTR